jgi:hypothetical protein
MTSMFKLIFEKVTKKNILILNFLMSRSSHGLATDADDRNLDRRLDPKVPHSRRDEGDLRRTKLHPLLQRHPRGQAQPQN